MRLGETRNGCGVHVNPSWAAIAARAAMSVAECCALAGQALDALVNVLDDAGLGDPESVDLRTAVLTGLVTQPISDDPGG